jgi:L-aspartate oxidase
MQSADFVIVGSGVAGLRAAIALAGAGRVIVLTKAAPGESNTGYAQGGIAAAIGDDDSPALHAADTVRAGDRLCDETAVRVLVEEGPHYVRELLDWGVRFDRAPDGRPELGREAAHSVRRVLHAGDATGREIGRVLGSRVRPLAAVTTIDHACVTELLLGSNGVRGVAYVDSAGACHEVEAAATLLATGGAGQVFRDTTNPGVATGDGIALAWRAGARTADLEFVQFHPTALNLAGAPRFLISEALRGEGGRLVNAAGEAFMIRSHPDGDLAPRDVVARGIAREVERTGAPVCLTLAHLDAAYVRHRFPTIAAMCRQVGLDLARDPIPVGPAAHYIMGGIQTDDWARTSIPGLYAAGEVACTGVHGANRLASNSLLEGLVFGARAAAAMQEGMRPGSLRIADVADGSWLMAEDRQSPSATLYQPSAVTPIKPLTTAEIRELMWRSVGLFRTRERLLAAVEALRRCPTPDDWSQRTLLTVAHLIAMSALRREESRGAHFREDFPARDDERWRVHLMDQRDD